jgi:hypothetical protein
LAGRSRSVSQPAEFVPRDSSNHGLATIPYWLFTDSSSESICASVLEKHFFRCSPKRTAMIAQPLLIVFLMDFFEPCSTMSIPWAWFLAVLCVLTALYASFFTNKVSVQCIAALDIQMCWPVPPLNANVRHANARCLSWFNLSQSEHCID